MMLRTLFTHSLTSGRLLCPRCLVALSLRHASQTHYETLGIEKNASQAEIKSAFLQLSKQVHPDVNRKDPRSNEKFVKLNEAYMVLSKPLKRREYDLNLHVLLRMEKQRREASSSHVHGSSAWPGTGYEKQFEAQQQQFWDETIWHMRDQSKDKEYEGKPYYGFTNIKKLSNLDVVLGCVALMAVGAVLHYFAIAKSSRKHKELLNEKDKEYFNTLAKARSYARTHGNALQLQILKSKVNKTPLDVEGVQISQDTLNNTFTQVRK